MTIDLSQVSLFKGFSTEELEKLKPYIREKNFKKGEKIHSEGMPCEGIFIVQEGEVRLCRTSSVDSEQTLEVLKRFEMCACCTDFRSSKCPVTPQAATDCKVSFLPRQEYAQWVEGHSKFSPFLANLLAKRLLKFSTLIDKFERKNQELETFASIASHDLQEPLRIISMYLELLAMRYKGQLDVDADDFISIAQESAKRSQNLIQSLLDYARIRIQQTELKKIDFNSVLEQVLCDLKLAIQDSGAVITNTSLPALKTSESQMVHLFQNLISNAIKYRSKRPLKISISAQRKDTEWIFSVQDNGIGIDPQHKDRIFEMFQRLHTKEEYEGTGIGLAVCKKIVECHGGKIWIESKLNEGSIFYFALPSD